MAGPLRALRCGALSRAGTSLLSCPARRTPLPRSPCRPRQARCRGLTGCAACGGQGAGRHLPSPAQAPQPRTCRGLGLRACAAVGRPIGMARPTLHQCHLPGGAEVATTAAGSVASLLSKGTALGTHLGHQKASAQRPPARGPGLHGR